MDERDRDARLETWFRAYGDRVLAYLLHRTDPETAQDVLQEVFVIAFRKAAAVPEPPLGWLFGTARRVLANAHRGARRRERLIFVVAEHARTYTARPGEPDANSIDTHTPVGDALSRLSSADREVLTLSSWYELSSDEAAQALGCSRGAYTVRLHRARRRLAERLAEDSARQADDAERRSVPVRLTEALGD